MRVLMIDNGRLLADGTVSELCAEAQLPETSLENLFAHLVDTAGVDDV